MRILITGATGLVGTQIVKVCNDNNIDVNYLTTSKSKIKKTNNYQGFYWNVKKNEIDKACLVDVDAIIHLAGASVSKRWTSDYKKEILDSRIQSTQLLINTLKIENNHTVKHVISASGIGIYPSSLVNYYDENFKERDTSFLADVVTQWEEAVCSFKNINIDVSLIRIGLVLSEKGGALPQMLTPIKLGLGSAFGNGKQWQSWVHLEDLANMFHFILENRLTGVYNAVAPNPVLNEELTKTIAIVLKKPFFLPNTPKFLMKIVLGEMHNLLFDSQRVSSKKIESKDFYFKYRYLKTALENLLLHAN